MFRPIRMDHTNCLQVAIKTLQFGLVQGSTLKGKFLSDPEFAFTLEAYAIDTPAPDILPKESNRVLRSIIDS
jgi:hypothetical protein